MREGGEEGGGVNKGGRQKQTNREAEEQTENNRKTRPGNMQLSFFFFFSFSFFLFLFNVFSHKICDIRLISQLAFALI